MDNNEAREKILSIITEKVNVTPGEINYISKIPLIQVYTIAKKLIEEKLIVMEQKDNNKVYSLFDKENPTHIATEKVIVHSEKTESLVEEPKEVKAKMLKPIKSGGRDLTKYKFNGLENLSKGRLALEIIKQYAKDKKPSYKNALALFADDIAPPYGFLRPVAEAKKISKDYLRFFINDEVRLKDISVCISNQMNTERIQKVIEIAKNELGYKIK